MNRTPALAVILLLTLGRGHAGHDVSISPGACFIREQSSGVHRLALLK